MGSIWTLFDPNITEPQLASVETPALTQLFLNKMAAVKEACCHQATTENN